MRVTLTLDITAAAPLSGQLQEPDGTVHDFVGWLAFYRVLDALARADGQEPMRVTVTPG